MDFLKTAVEVVTKAYLIPLSIAVVFWISKLLPDLVPIGDISENNSWALTGYISTIYSILYPVGKLGTPLKSLWHEYREQSKLKAQIKHLEEFLRHQLTQEEKEILKQYISEDRRSIYFRLSNGAIGHLCKVGILYRGSEISSVGDRFGFVIQDFAMDFLKKNTTLLD